MAKKKNNDYEYDKRNYEPKTDEYMKALKKKLKKNADRR